jgi:hypothetical protein
MERNCGGAEEVECRMMDYEWGMDPNRREVVPCLMHE